MARLAEEIAAEKGFEGVADAQCRMAQLNLDSCMWLGTFLDW
jgi:hypothetical protein